MRTFFALLALLPTVAFAAPSDPQLRAVAADAIPEPVAAGVALEPGRVVRWGGGSFVQVEQRVDGLRVEGGRLVVAADPDGLVRSVHGTPVDAPLLSTSPSVDAADAIRFARELADEEYGTGSLWPDRAELVAFARRGAAHLSWAVDVSTREPLGAHRIYVDAHDGRLLGARQTLHTATGTVYPFSPADEATVQVELEGVDGELSNDYAFVNSCTDFDGERWQCNAKTRYATPDDNGDFHYSPNPLGPEDAFAEVHMFHHIGEVARFFEDEFGFRTDFGFAGEAVEGIVNFELANAFYGDADGDSVPEIAFGQGNGVDFAYDADVIYHEFGHAVFGQIVDGGSDRYDEYGRIPTSSGLNEGSADVFSLVLTQDPALGEYSGSGFGGDGAIRHLEADRHCPTDLYGQSHQDGETWAALGWNLIEDPEVGNIVTAHLYFGALSVLTEEVTWELAGHALLESAEALLESGFIDAAQKGAIDAHIAAAGLDDCGRVVRLDEGATPRRSMSFFVRGDGTERPQPLLHQFSLDAPEGAVELRFSVDELTNPDLAYRLFVRRGEHIVHELVETAGGGGGTRVTAVADEYDFELLDSDTGVVLTLNADSDPALEPGATYYFSITSARVEGSEERRLFGDIVVSGEADVVPVEPADDDDDEGAACSDCGASVGGGATTGLLLLPLLGLRRRR